MSALSRFVVRVGAALLLVGLLVVLPVAVIVLVGLPELSVSHWRSLWTTGRVDGALVVQVGTVLFVVLWAWFAVTALAELWHVAQRVVRREPVAPLERGPSRLVRGLVRLAVLSGAALVTMSTGATTGATDTLLQTTRPAPVVDAVVVGPRVALPPNQVMSAVPRPASSSTSGLTAAVLLSAGALAAVEVRRRRRLRASDVGEHWPPPAAGVAETEMLLRSIGAGERVARLDLALRVAARDLAVQRACVVAASLEADGAVLLYIDRPATPRSGAWESSGATWCLPATVLLEELAPGARECAQPCPALAHLGGVEGGGEFFVDLEAVGVLAIDSPHGSIILRALAASMSVSPFLDAGRVFTAGLDDGVLDWTRGVDCPDLASAQHEAHLLASYATTNTMSTFALRVRGTAGEAWEPAVVIGTVGHDDVVVPRRGVGMALSGVDAEYRLEFDGCGHVLQPLGVRVLPIGLERSVVRSLRAFVVEAEQPLPFEPPAVNHAPFEEPEWSLMVRVLGQVEVVSCDGESVAFDRSKALELAVWLSQHRERSTRTAARTALWDLEVRSATFANVVSDARRAMARVAEPPHGEEWIARTLTEDLPLHPQVVTDAELLAARVAAARGCPHHEAIEVLRPGLELITGLPFSGTNYLWTDAEGHSSALVLLATGAAIELAHRYLAVGDVDGVFWATGQGLRVLSGHEELIALRMRAHAQRGDLAGVRHEWESYERALAADPWAAAEPAPKLVALRRELLSPMVRTTA
ncbi:MAG: hypothetical protein HY828_04765 [Actinobacteria bacterium]|nr:hypothetical protein [Actinomycetota bacterium]